MATANTSFRLISLLVGSALLTLASPPVPFADAGAAATTSQTGYVLGPDDQLAIRILQAPDMASAPVRVDLNGYIEMPYVGRIKAAGQTLQAFRSDLTEKLRSVIHDPEVSVSVEEFRSQPVSVVGAVASPGVQQVRGEKKLMEVLSMAGGLRADAGSTVNISRLVGQGAIGLPGEKSDASGRYNTATVDVHALYANTNPAMNVSIEPNDVITVPTAEKVYVVGEVLNTGGIPLLERKSISIAEAITIAGGLNRTASAQNAKILRPTGNGDERTEIPVDVRNVLAGKATDQSLNANDILFIPGSGAKRATLHAIEAAIAVGAGVAILH